MGYTYFIKIRLLFKSLRYVVIGTRGPCPWVW